MKVTAAKVAQFISSPPDTVRAVLLYGPDAGLVRERAELLTKLIVEDPKDHTSQKGAIPSGILLKEATK